MEAARPSFGSLLRRLRTEAGLTQEELAERAQLSSRSVSDLERSVNASPRRFTLVQLADALDLTPADRADFERAAIGAALASALEAQPRGHFLGAIPDGRMLGREGEMDRMGAILDSTREGAGHVLLLAGEAGTGKTRLLQELSIAASKRGFAVLTAGCFIREQRVPYHPFLDAMAGLPQDLPVSARPGVRKGLKAIEDLIARANGAGQVTQSSSQQVADAVADAFLRASRATPVALLLDDLQWADPSSLKLLEHLARAAGASRILVAAAFCDDQVVQDHPELAHTLQLLTHDRLAERIAVRRLSLDETAAMVADRMGQTVVSDEFASFVYRRTKGVPLLVEAMVWSLGGRLELRGEIGAGSTGRVFCAFDRRTDRMVAAKLVLAREGIDLSDLLRFQREGAVLASLDHPNIVHVYDTFAEEHAVCIIMELLDGRSLAQILGDGPIELAQANTIAIQTAEALDHAHRHSIVHRDVKPDNVMVLAGDHVKVTDFGIARILRTDNSLATMATTGMRAGTPSYMAPEQIAGKETDGRADVYALGAMLFHMVTGRPPFEGPDKLSVAVKHLQEPPLAPSSINPSVPSDWNELILKALQKEPARRFQTAREMGAALAALGASRAASSRTALQRRANMAATAAVALAVLVLAAVLVSTWPGTSHAAGVAPRVNAYMRSLAGDNRFSGTVLVARGRTVLLDKGYGLANRQTGAIAGADTRYAVPGVTAIISIAALLQYGHTTGASFAVSDPICRFLSPCSSRWRSITVRMLLDGTANLPHTDAMEVVGNSPSQSLANCEAVLLDGRPGSKIDYENCGDLAMGLILKRVSGNAWETAVAGVTGLAGMRNTGQMSDAVALTPSVARAYGAGPPLDTVFNDDIVAYSTAADVFAFDNAFFDNRVLSPRETAALLRPRGTFSASGCCALANPGIAHPQWASEWKTGKLFGRRVYYTFRGKDGFLAVNMRFPSAGVTVVVLSNDQSSDTLGGAMHVAALTLRAGSAPSIPRSAAAPAVLLGTYRRTFTKADLQATSDSALQPSWVGGTLGLRITPRLIEFGVPGTSIGSTDEYYAATRNGKVTLLGYPPTNANSMCTDIPTETPPYGRYRWRRQGKTLIIKRAAPDPCFDRRGIMPGRWTKVT